MKRLLFILCIFLTKLGFSQTRELYFGTSFSDYRWKEHPELNSDTYGLGAHIGLLKGRSDKKGCFRKYYRSFYPFFGAEYSFFNHQTSDLQASQFHVMKAFASLRYNMIGSKEKFNSLFIMAEPGAAAVFQQKAYSTRQFESIQAAPFEVFLQVGFGGQIGFKRAAPLKDSYRCTGMNLSVTKYFSVTPFSFQKESIGKLDQVRLNVGFNFGYVKAKKSLLRFWGR